MKKQSSSQSIIRETNEFPQSEKTMVNNNGYNVNDVSRISAGTVFSGDFATANDIRIDGTFEGRLYCAGRLVVGEKGVVKGDIMGQNIDFSGTMIGGNLYVKDTLSLKSGCTVEGDLYFQRLQVDLEAKFTGSCRVLPETEFLKVASPLYDMLPAYVK